MSKQARGTLVRVGNRYQVTIPTRFRKQAGLSVGDLLKASIQRDRLTLIPAATVERELEIGRASCRERV